MTILALSILTIAIAFGVVTATRRRAWHAEHIVRSHIGR